MVHFTKGCGDAKHATLVTKGYYFEKLEHLAVTRSNIMLVNGKLKHEAHLEHLEEELNSKAKLEERIK